MKGFIQCAAPLIHTMEACEAFIWAEQQVMMFWIQNKLNCITRKFIVEIDSSN